MIPDWRAALANAISMLRPGGRLAVLDFTLTPQQSRFGRLFWRRWFAHDGVRLDTEHPAALRRLLPRHEISQRRTPVPYLPAVTVPYYLFLGVRA